MHVWKTSESVYVCVCAGFIEFNSALALKVEEKKLSEISNFALRYDPRTVGWLTQNVCLSHRNRRNGGPFLQSLLCLSVSLSVLPSAVCLDWTDPDEGDFPGKVIWKEKKRLNSKSMFHYISFPLCVWCVWYVCVYILWVELLFSTLKALCFSSSDHQKSNLYETVASCTHWGEAGYLERREAGRKRSREGEKESQVEFTSRLDGEHQHSDTIVQSKV